MFSLWVNLVIYHHDADYKHDPTLSAHMTADMNKNI